MHHRSSLYHPPSHKYVCKANPPLSCNNCGKPGHPFYQCKEPITSCGILAFRYSPDLEFLMIRRKDSFGMIDLIRGKYHPHNVFQVQSIIDQLSLSEKQRLLQQSFAQLWCQLWGIPWTEDHLPSPDEVHAGRKFQQLVQGVEAEDGTVYTLASLLAQSRTQWTETEWEFPKGRRNPKEREMDCALREFQEETGIPPSSLDIVENMFPLEETFIGTNLKPYKHKYFLAHCNHHAPLTTFQPSEVSHMLWKPANQCIEAIRSYQVEKQEVVMRAHALLTAHPPLYLL